MIIANESDDKSADTPTVDINHVLELLEKAINALATRVTAAERTLKIQSAAEVLNKYVNGVEIKYEIAANYCALYRELYVSTHDEFLEVVKRQDDSSMLLLYERL